MILTKLVNGCELNFGIFRSVWISEMLECMVLFYLFWTEFGFCDVYGVRKVVWVCSMSEVPPKGEHASGILLYYYYLQTTIVIG